MTVTRYIALFSFLWLLFMPAQQACATPPLTISVQDQPIAVSETHFYVIRHMTDNGGLYSLERSKTYIVKLETETSQITAFHKLQEANQHILEFPGQEPQASISANEAFNLFTYLASENAFQTGLVKEYPHETISIEKKKGHYLLSCRLIENGEEQNSIIYKSNLAALIKASHKPILSDYIGPIPEPVPNNEIYLITQNFETLPGGACTLEKVIKAPQPLSKWDNRQDPKEYIAYIRCGAAGDGLHIEATLPLALVFKPTKK